MGSEGGEAGWGVRVGKQGGESGKIHICDDHKIPT